MGTIDESRRMTTGDFEALIANYERVLRLKASADEKGERFNVDVEGINATLVDLRRALEEMREQGNNT